MRPNDAIGERARAGASMVTVADMSAAMDSRELFVVRSGLDTASFSAEKRPTLAGGSAEPSDC